MKGITRVLKPWIAAALASASLAASCARGADAAPVKGEALRYQDTIALTRETALGPAVVYLALPASGSGELWFFFHGSGSIDASAVERIKRFAPAGGPPPAIAALTFGPQWNLTDRTEKRGFSSSAVFWEEILPMVEERAGGAARMTGIGYSMGGFNLLSLFADRPGAWDALVFLNPALTEMSPAAGQEEIDAYVARTKAYSSKQWLRSLFGGRLDLNIRAILSARGRLITMSEERWKELSPLARLRAMEGRDGIRIPILVAYAKQDEFGFSEGASKLAALLGADPQLRIHPFRGSHADIPEDAVSDFFAELARQPPTPCPR